jgi:hypothetical protein
MPKNLALIIELSNIWKCNQPDQWRASVLNAVRERIRNPWYFIHLLLFIGARGSVVVKELCCKPERPGFKSR